MSTHSLAGEQIVLFSPPAHLAKLLEEANRLMEASRAPNTLKAYNFSWKGFVTWCREYDRQALPAQSATVREFVTWSAKLREPRYALETIRLAVSAISHRHLAAAFPNPVDRDVRLVLAGLAREQARAGYRPETAGKKQLSVDLLRRICRSLRDDEPIDVRDRAVILLGFASALRRSNLSALDRRDVHLDGAGLRLWIGYSKTDQEGKGREVAIPYGKHPYTCPVRALEAWLALRGPDDGALFCRFHGSGQMRPDLARLSGQSICNILKRALERVREDARDYGAHSLRSGMMTASAKRANVRDIMDRTGHKTMEMVLRYIKSAQAFETDPLAGVL